MSEDPHPLPRPIGLIGGIGLTEVRVYEQRPAPDGLCSGCPHVHAATDEGYFVLEGKGYVEFHDPEHGYRRLDLAPGDYAHFPPWTVHRLVSLGGLLILGIMGNAGLAEAGEARIYFGPDIDEDPDTFAHWTGLAKTEGLEGALERRDQAVKGYAFLVDLWEKGDRKGHAAELRRFFDQHARAMADRRNDFTQKVRQGPLQWAETTLSRLTALPEVRPGDGEVFINRRGKESAFGMCGVLRPLLQLESLDPNPVRHPPA